MVAFTAVWCAPCAWLDPYLAEAVRAIESGVGGEGALRIFKVDVDLVPEAAARYRIGSVPIVLLFREGEELERSVGVEPERIRGMVRRALGER
jgi:thioredoxin 1